MPLALDGGADVALQRNPVTGRFDLLLDASGNPTFTDSEEHTVLSLLLEDQGGYWADETGKRGSRLRQIRHDTRNTRGEIVSAIKDALAFADDGRISDVTADAARVEPGKWKATFTYRNRRGHVQNLNLPYGY